MEKKCLLWYVIFLTSALFLSCEDGDSGIDTSAMLEIYGEQYELAGGVIWACNKNVVIPRVEYLFRDTYIKDGQEVTDDVVGFAAGEGRLESGNFMLSLYEPGLLYNPELKETKGKGACVCFHLASSEQDKLVPGKYVYGPDKAGMTFMGYSSSMYDMEGKDEIYSEITEGEVTIEPEGSAYHVVFRCQTSFGAAIRGEYRGPLDLCDVEKATLMHYEKINIMGLQELVHRHQVFPDERPDYFYSEVDFDTDPAFFSTRTGSCQLGRDGGREEVEIALAYDDENEVLYFESPIKMRALMGHTPAYHYPCHTIYMRAPESFTDADYEKLEETGFTFDMVEEKVNYPVDAFRPGYVFFEAGTGNKGVIRLIRLTPPVELAFSPIGTFVVYTMTAPGFMMDVKSSVRFANPGIR